MTIANKINEVMMLKDNLATNLDLSYDFQLVSSENRLAKVKVLNVIRKFDFGESYMTIFFEDLIYFLSQQGFVMRFDFDKIEIYNLKVLGLEKAELEEMHDFLSKVTNWEVSSYE